MSHNVATNLVLLSCSKNYWSWACVISHCNSFSWCCSIPSLFICKNRWIAIDIQNSSWKSFQLSLNSSTKKWEKLAVVEIKGFMTCIWNVGVIFRPSLESYWFTCPSQYMLWFMHCLPGWSSSSFWNSYGWQLRLCRSRSTWLWAACKMFCVCGSGILFEPYCCPSALDLFWWNLALSDFYVFGKLKDVLEIIDFHLMASSKLRSKSGFESNTSLFTIRAWKISSYSALSAWTSTVAMWKIKDWWPSYNFALVVSTCLHSPGKKMETLFLIFPFIDSEFPI
jgi:hypothetical protein